MPRSQFPESTTPVMYPQIGNSPATPDSIAPKDLEDPKKNLLFRPHSPNDYEAGLNHDDFLFSLATPPLYKPTEQELDYQQPYSALPSSDYYYPPQSPAPSIPPQDASNATHPNRGNSQEEENPFFEEGSLLSSLFGNFSHQNRPSHNPPPANIPREPTTLTKESKHLTKPPVHGINNSLIDFLGGNQNRYDSNQDPILQSHQQPIHQIPHQPPKPPQQKPRATGKTPKDDRNFFESFLNIFQEDPSRNKPLANQHNRMANPKPLPPTARPPEPQPQKTPKTSDANLFSIEKLFGPQPKDNSQNLFDFLGKCVPNSAPKPDPSSKKNSFAGRLQTDI